MKKQTTRILVTTKGIDSVIENLQQTKVQSQTASLGNSGEHLEKKLTAILLKLSQK